MHLHFYPSIFYFCFDCIVANLIKRLTFGGEYDDSLVKLPYLVLSISIILSLGFTYLFYQSSASKDLIRFNGTTRQIQMNLENKLNSYIALLKSGRAFIETTEKFDRKKFKTYIDSLELEKNYVGLVGVGFNKAVTPEERENLIAEMKKEGFTDFKIFPTDDNQIDYPIIYLEPLNELNRRAIGYDMFSEPVRRQALEKARDFSTEAASGKVVLIQDSEDTKHAGFLIYLPVYKAGKIPASIEERRQNLLGFIYCPFRARDFVKSAVDNQSFPDIEFKIYDYEIKEENILAQTETATNRNLASEKENQGFYSKNNLEVAGRRWVIEYSPTIGFFDQSNQRLTPIVFLIGTLFSFLLFALTYAQAKSRRKLQEIAENLLEVEQEKADLFEKEKRARLFAEQAAKTKDEFISVVSHELRTPLNAIAGWAKILKSDNLSRNTKELALQKIEKNLRSQTKLVEELLDFSQIMSGKVNIESEEFSFSDVFEKVLVEIEPKAEEKEVGLTKINNLDGQMVIGDRSKIKIVIENLLLNAIKFTPSGGKIEAEVGEEDGKIVLTVKDNGNGINQEFLPFIFDRFRQQDGSLTKFHGGLGLGLAITEHIIKLHNGTIEAESEGAKKGSIFRVKIPVK